MKLVTILMFTLSLATNAFATGGFDCVSKDQTFKIFAVNSYVYGSPIIGNIHTQKNGTRMQIDKVYIVGYWNIEDELRIAISDETYSDQAYLLKTRRVAPSELFTGTVLLPGEEKEKKISCEVY